MVADTCTVLPWDMVGYQPVLYSVRKECFKCLHRHPFGTQYRTKVLFWGGKNWFHKDIFRCFYCHPFKDQEFVSKNAKILLLLKGVPEMDLGLDYFLFPLHGHMDRLVLVYRSRIECFPMVASSLPCDFSPSPQLLTPFTGCTAQGCTPTYIFNIFNLFSTYFQ